MGLENQGGIGLVLILDGNIVIVNWRIKIVFIVIKEGELVNKFISFDFQEFIDIVVNSKGEIIVVDNGVNKMLMFDVRGKFFIFFGGKGDKDGQFKFICVIVIGKCDEILVVDNRIQIFSRDGKFLRMILD